MEDRKIYEDIALRTEGDIYIGVVGPVRTGKSTFIKRFMETLVIPNIENVYRRERARDELPQSGSGRTIMTAEPKFVPEEAVAVQVDGGAAFQMRMIDCVGYLVPGAVGQLEGETERMVTTPWFEHEIPMAEAAEIGTRKVIKDHSTIGIVVTCDGSFGELGRDHFLEAEARTITELQNLGKPFIVLLNSAKPYAEETRTLADEISEKYQVTVMPVNCEQLKREDINHIMENILYEFPLTMIEFYMPKWVEMLPYDHKMKQDIIVQIKNLMGNLSSIRDITAGTFMPESEYIKKCKLDGIDMSDGRVRILLDVDDSYYYEMISDLVGETVGSEYQMLAMLKEMAKMKREYVKVLHALESVRYKGYGVVMPDREEIMLEKPELIRQGNKFGVKIKAESPSIHMSKASIETEISPIVGTEEQARDLIQFISDTETSEEGIWETNIFGKTVEQLVNDGITGKISMINEESQIKLQETMQKIVNDCNGGMVCIII